MRSSVLLLGLVLSALTSGAPPSWELFACVNNSKGYVVGAKLSPSGLFRRGTNEWQHLGFNHPFVSTVASGPTESTLYLAAGNGLIRLSKSGANWRILTGSDVTELRDVAVNLQNPQDVYFAHTRGIAASENGGQTWRDASGDLHRRYTESIRIDRKTGALLAATEAGIYRSENGGAHWMLAGAAGFQTLRVEQSPHDECRWLASTELGGFFASTDCGKTFENTGNQIAVDRSILDIAWDKTHPHRVAAAGWGFGVAISEDDGAHWEFRNQGLPRNDAVSVIWDPAGKDDLYASVHEEAVFRSRDAGRTWVADGLRGTDVNRFVFLPEAR